MTERREVHKALDLALWVGEILLVSGAGAADVPTAMLAVTDACGLRGVSADVTFTDLTLRHKGSPDEPATTLVRRVTRRPVDYATLIEADRIIGELTSGRISRDEARAQVARAVSSGPTRARWAVLIGWGLMGAGVALTLGGAPLVCALAFIAAVAINSVLAVLPRKRIPTFYQQAAGGFVATLIAVVVAAIGMDVNPSRVVTSGIVLLLAGVGITGAIQDAITGFPVTATARLLDAVLNTTGILAGVAAGLTLGSLIGVEVGTLDPILPGLVAAGATVIGAAFAAGGFAFASRAPLRALVAVALVAGLGQAVLHAVSSIPLSRTWGAAAAGTAIGAVCYLVSGRFRVPPLVVVVPAIVPLLPGLDIYRGLALLADGQDGVLQLASAFAIALALAAGVTLGQYLARPLRREARRLEHRFSGPPLVGPFRRRGRGDVGKDH